MITLGKSYMKMRLLSCDKESEWLLQQRQVLAAYADHTASTWSPWIVITVIVQYVCTVHALYR